MNYLSEMALCWVTIWRMSVQQDITRIHPRRTKLSMNRQILVHSLPINIQNTNCIKAILEQVK